MCPSKKDISFPETYNLVHMAVFGLEPTAIGLYLKQNVLHLIIIIQHPIGKHSSQNKVISFKMNDLNVPYYINVTISHKVQMGHLKKKKKTKNV